MTKRKTYVEPKLYKSEESLEKMTLWGAASPCDHNWNREDLLKSWSGHFD